MSILLSLLAAASYGLGDFTGGIFSKRAGAWAVALVAQVGGAVLVLLLALVTDGSVTRVDVWWSLLAGVGNGFGTAFLYRGLASGRMGVVAPVSAVGAVLVPVAVGLLAGERPGTLVYVGIALALPAIWLVSREPVASSPGDGNGSGLVDGVLAGLGFGTLFAALAQIPEEAGFLPLAINQLVAGVAIIAVATTLRAPWVPRTPIALGGIVPGALGALATGLFLVATHGGYLTVTAVITSLYPAFTVLLAATVLHEPVHRAQSVGLGLCACAVALVAAGLMDAVVVGSGPNGLAAAITLAQQGLSVTVLEGHDEIGGGTRTAELTVPGVLHDVCSAIHPLGISSPYLSSLPLADHGLVWRWPEVDVAHPLDDGSAGVIVRSLDETADGLGSDGDRWRGVFGPLAERYDDLATDVLGPVLRLPDHPVLMARFGLRAGLPASVLARRFRTDAARALFAGCAAHVSRPLDRPATSSAGTLLIAAGHRHGWPVAEGGSRAITDAMASLLRSLGGTVETGVRVTSLDELPAGGITLFDTTPTAFAAIAGDRLPARQRRSMRRWRYGYAAYKVDLAVRDGVPWTAEACRRAGTVHLGGTFEEIARGEAEVNRGVMPARPYVLVGQQYLADPTRSAGDVHPVWAYAHVPHGYTGDATAAVLDQIERFAPGFRERIVAQHVTDPAGFEAYNPNYVGGDIASGATTVRQLVARPRPTLDPYATAVPGSYLCSSSTPPGPGVHGMCGHRAALRALADLRSS